MRQEKGYHDRCIPTSAMLTCLGPSKVHEMRARILEPQTKFPVSILTGPYIANDHPKNIPRYRCPAHVKHYLQRITQD